MKLNQKGYTLIEVLAVIVLIAVLSGIAIPKVLTTINAGKTASEKILIDNIKTAAKGMFEEIELTGKKEGNTILFEEDINIYIEENNNEKSMKISLQDLVKYGFIKGTIDKTTQKIEIKNTNGKDIGNCKIIVTKTLKEEGNKYAFKYTFKKDTTNKENSDDDICPNI